MLGYTNAISICRSTCHTHYLKTLFYIYFASLFPVRLCVYVCVCARLNDVEEEVEPRNKTTKEAAAALCVTAVIGRHRSLNLAICWLKMNRLAGCVSLPLLLGRAMRRSGALFAAIAAGETCSNSLIEKRRSKREPLLLHSTCVRNYFLHWRVAYAPVFRAAHTHIHTRNSVTATASLGRHRFFLHAVAASLSFVAAPLCKRQTSRNERHCGNSLRSSRALSLADQWL